MVVAAVPTVPRLLTPSSHRLETRRERGEEPQMRRKLGVDNRPQEESRQSWASFIQRSHQPVAPGSAPSPSLHACAALPADFTAAAILESTGADVPLKSTTRRHSLDLDCAYSCTGSRCGLAPRISR
jgi:hypothetical protein